MQRSRWMVLTAFVAALGGAACSPGHDAALDTSAAKTGSLGNGDFYFTCDDSVACSKYRNVSKDFPDAVAEGAVFHVQYQLFSNSITLKDNVPGQGYTLATVGRDYLTVGPEGFTGVQAGYGTVIVRTAEGHVVDFTTMKIAKPDAIAVYDLTEEQQGGAKLVTNAGLTMTVNDEKSLSAVARQHQADLAGVFEADWISDATDTVTVGTRVGGKISIQAMKAGTAHLTVQGAALTQQVTITVEAGK
jgi:hypothetical protein